MRNRTKDIKNNRKLKLDQKSICFPLLRIDGRWGHFVVRFLLSLNSGVEVLAKAIMQQFSFVEIAEKLKLLNQWWYDAWLTELFILELLHMNYCVEKNGRKNLRSKCESNGEIMKRWKCETLHCIECKDELGEINYLDQAPYVSWISAQIPLSTYLARIRKQIHI